jgi:hypothetical protein
LRIFFATGFRATLKSLAKGVTVLDVQQLRTIRVHLALVNAHDPKTSIPFIQYTKAFFKLVDEYGNLEML